MFARPATLDEAFRVLRAQGGQVLAGGTDVFPALVDRPQTAPFVDLARVPGLRGVSIEGGAARIGAATTWTDILRADLPPAFDALKQAARCVGSVQIQNRGTLGGNLCNASPAADGVPPLLALDAQVELASQEGVRRLALPAFLVGPRRTLRRPDEILTAIVVPMPGPGARAAFVKLGSRRYLVISIVMAAAVAACEDGRIVDARIAVGAASAVARRLPAYEARLIGMERGGDLAPTPDELAALAPIDDVRATAAYRMDAARTLVARAVGAALGDG